MIVHDDESAERRMAAYLLHKRWAEAVGYIQPVSWSTFKRIVWPTCVTRAQAQDEAAKLAIKLDEEEHQ